MGETIRDLDCIPSLQTAPDPCQSQIVARSIDMTSQERRVS